jgi:hypothetical protein
MNRYVTKTKVVDFEELGYETMLQSGNLEQARNICALHIHAYADEMQPELTSLQSGIRENKNHGAALHAHLYDRPIPVNDASMLTYVLRWRLLLTLMVFAGVACFAGNTVTFYLFGFGLFLTVLLAAGTTALPLVIGHLGYERIVAKHKGLQIGIIAAAVVLCFVGLYELAVARQVMVDRQAVAVPALTSYVDGAPADPAGAQDPKPDSGKETRVRQTLGGAMLMIMIAADLMLGLLAGLLSRMHTDEDYAAWRNLKKITRMIARLEERVSQLTSFVEIAKKRCSAGILRAQVVFSKRKIPYYRALGMLILCALLCSGTSQAQAIQRHEVILIDSSISIAKAGGSNVLFQEYLLAARKLLLTEPANSRVWVLSIATDSFGGAGEILKGWTPDSRGVFTDDLNRARSQLSASFEQKSVKLAPGAFGTDIFGALWRFKTLSESVAKSDQSQLNPKTIWIFSDMMNETREFPMPKLITRGPERMLDRAKAIGLLVPLSGYKVYVYGATPNGLTPQAWNTIRIFWVMYFKAAGAELVTYSAECDVQR